MLELEVRRRKIVVKRIITKLRNDLEDLSEKYMERLQMYFVPPYWALEVNYEKNGICCFTLFDNGRYS